MAKRFTIVAGLVVLLAIVSIFSRQFGNSRSRVEREHGLRLPISAEKFECRGDAWRGFLDRGAVSAFVLSSNELASFVSELKPLNSGFKTFIPGNRQYQLDSKWRAGVPMVSYSCASLVGDWLHVEIWPIDAAHVGVCLYTDWN